MPTQQSVEISPGVLIKPQLEQLFESGAITSHNFGRPDIDASAFDLRLGKTVWSLKEGQRPATRELAKIKAQSSIRTPQTDGDGEYFEFDPGNLYLVELDNHLQLPSNISGRATGKSSIGRLDVITRLLTDDSREYDVVEAGYSGPLHLLVLSQTFSIKMRVGASLNQLRLFSGAPHFSVISRYTIKDFGTPFWYVEHQDRKGDYESWESILENINRASIAEPTLFDLTVDLADPTSNYICKARVKVNESIDLRKGKESHNPADYFEKIPIDRKDPTPSVVLQEDSFYIMKSKERLYVPLDVAVEVIAISERIGDIRIHYAGFAHPGFGRDNPKKRGTPLIFEVRATDMQTRLYDGSLLAKIQLFRISQGMVQAKSSYDDQELKLSNVFGNWPD